MIRTFHPVGQGAFYSERHSNFNIVYDCGTTSPRRARRVVEKAFKDEVVDILFISHFDSDHISSIPDLKNSVKQIRIVVLPLLNNQQKNLLLNFYKEFSADLKSIIDNPESYFGSNTTVIRVLPAAVAYDMERRFEPLDLRELINNDLNESIEIESGTPLTIPSTVNGQTIKWAFIPYNYEDKVRRIVIDRELNKAGISSSILMSNPNYALSNLEDIVIRKQKTMHTIYDKLKGKINQNSMLLYSGPDLPNDLNDCKPYHTYHYRSFSSNLNYYHTCLCMSGCIYTGDSDFKCFKLKDIYKGYVNNVDIVQVPHHGSKHNFDLQALEGFSNVICPISHSTNNRDKHPHAEVVKKLTINGFHVISINENRNSEFRQFV